MISVFEVRERIHFNGIHLTPYVLSSCKKVARWTQSKAMERSRNTPMLHSFASKPSTKSSTNLLIASIVDNFFPNPNWSFESNWNLLKNINSLARNVLYLAQGWKNWDRFIVFGKGMDCIFFNYKCDFCYFHLSWEMAECKSSIDDFCQWGQNMPVAVFD